MHLQEKTIGSETTYQGKVFYVTKDTAQLEDGKAVQRDVVHHSGGVCVVPLTEKGTVLMVKQFRYPMQASWKKAKIRQTAANGNSGKRQDAPAANIRLWENSSRRRHMIQKSSICIWHRNCLRRRNRSWTRANFWM